MALGPADAQTDPLAPLPPVMVPTYTAASPFDAYKQQLAARARRSGVREGTIQAYLPTVRLNSRVMQLDRSQPGGPPNSSYIPPFSPYQREHVTPSLIRRGQARYASMYRQLAWIQSRYGVDPGVLMAIYGHETSFGAVTGGFDLLDALASLAYEGRRRELFESEFVAALKLIDLGIPRWRLKGSYAGATGYPQFMPSVVLRLRADGDGDGYSNIWSSEADGLASIANYLRQAGWKPGLPWGIAVRVPPTLNRAAIRSTLRAPRCERVYSRHSRWLTMREWRALGVVPYRGWLPETEMATLIEPDGPNQTAYLLTTNYRAILDYNCSNFYALSVGLLANAIVGR
jgi:lytic murein transglycosylase